MKKKILIFVLVTALAASLLLLMVYCGGNYTGGLEFSPINGGEEYEVSGIGEAEGTDIYIPKTYRGKPVTAIGAAAFAGRAELTSVNLPEGIKKIGESAFSGCSGLAAITIPKSVRQIGASAFRGCTALTDVILPDEIRAVGDFAFFGCEKLQYNMYDGAYYLGSDGNSYLMLMHAASADIERCEIHEDTKLIYGFAFDGCTKLTDISVPSEVRMIGKGAFFECEGLEGITLPFAGETANGASNTHFGYIFGAQSYSNNSLFVPSSLKSVTVTGAVKIDTCAFYGCEFLEELTVYDSLKTMGASALAGCVGLKSLTLPFIGAAGAEEENTHIGYIFGAPTYKENIGYVPSSLENVTVNGDGIGKFAFFDCTSLVSVNISDSVTAIGSDAFYHCTGLLSVSIGKNVRTIGESAFYYCSALTSIVIPEGVRTIGASAFRYCSKLKSVTLSEGLSSIGDYAFAGCMELTSISIPDTASEIGKNAFYHCASLTDVSIGKNVSSIGRGAFSYCASLTSISVAEGNLTYHSDGSCLIETVARILVFGCKDSIIPADGSVTAIGEYAFYRTSGLVSIVIPSAVTELGSNAFGACSGLQIIEYRGTSAEWNAITKSENWDSDTVGYTVRCTDGDVVKA